MPLPVTRDPARHPGTRSRTCTPRGHGNCRVTGTHGHGHAHEEGAAAPALEHVLAHELHHVGLVAACPREVADDVARGILGGFGERQPGAAPPRWSAAFIDRLAARFANDDSDR